MKKTVNEVDMSFDVEKETKKLLDKIPTECIKPVWDWYYCELDNSFVGFIENYARLNIPRDFTIIDIGCYQAVPAYYFKDHCRYIGVDISVPVENRLVQENAVYFKMSAQTFIQDILPKLVEDGLDLSKTFAICSAVPDEEAQMLVAQTFPYHRVTYPNHDDNLRTIS